MSVLSWIVSQVHPHSVWRKPSQYLQHYNTTTLQHSKMSSLSPTNPASGNFCRSAYWQVQRLHIQHHCFNFLWWSVEDLKAKWELIMERSRHKQALLTLQLHFWSLFINCCFNHKLFHWACMKNFCLHSLMKFVQKRDFEQLCISQIETSTSLPPSPPPASIPRACDTLTVPGGENLVIRVLQGVGNLNCTLNFMWNLWHGELSSGPWC